MTPEQFIPFSRERQWLVDNRHFYINRWVAIEGDVLLAEGESSAGGKI